MDRDGAVSALRELEQTLRAAAPTADAERALGVVGRLRRLIGLADEPTFLR